VSIGRWPGYDDMAVTLIGTLLVLEAGGLVALASGVGAPPVGDTLGYGRAVGRTWSPTTVGGLRFPPVTHR
jgi:hypothetical protein